MLDKRNPDQRANLERVQQQLRAVPLEPHCCAACHHRWDGPLTGAELCGDCWRKARTGLRAVPAGSEDGIGYDAETDTYVARYTILTAGRTEVEARIALANAVKMLAAHWPDPPAAPTPASTEDAT